MKRDASSDLDPELEAFLQPRKIQRQVPAELRARVLDRSRAIVAAGGAIPRLPASDSPPPGIVRGARARRLGRLALAASVAVAAGAVGAVAALRHRAARAPEIAAQESAPPAPKLPITNTATPSSGVRAPDAEPAAPAGPPRPARLAAKGDPLTAELRLLAQAHGAYTRRDFALALRMVAEHARRFPNGRLAEQREALRVRSLLGSGRADEADRAAAAFAIRFPRSVLLPRVEGRAGPAAP
jgi:hypothetical protein